MGKKSRLKREAAAARAAAPAPNILVKPDPLLVAAEGIKELNELLVEERRVQEFNERAERLNNLPIGHPDNAHKIGLTFDPIDQWIVELLENNGEYEVLASGKEAGTAIFKPRTEDEWYPIAESFRAVYDTFALIAEDQKIEDKGKPLLFLANKIDYDMPLEEKDIHAARSSIEWMKEVVKPFTPLQFSEFSKIIQARAIIREQGLNKAAA